MKKGVSYFMKIISAYVREQKRYTKNYLKQIYAFDEMEIEKFIKNLKAYGVLKSVRNNKEQLDLSNLMEEDIETINNEMMDSETISSNSMDSEMMDSEIISSNGMHSEMINNNSMNSETISNSIMNKKIIDSETIDNETVDSKTVHNETIDNETFQSETSLYVFTYVGIIIYGNRVIKIYPKYLLSASEIEPPVEEMKQVLKFLKSIIIQKNNRYFI